MDISQLYDNAKTLPLLPGVYLMHGKDDTVIYVGKAKKLRNRVSQYFAPGTKHNLKTYKMVHSVERFEVIIARSEFEALVLENSLIKQYTPKYNILLKDDKGYPYIRVNMKDDYPSLRMSSRAEDDGALYFGPFAGRAMTQTIIDSIQTSLKLPSCSKRLPRDIGKERPCLNYRMGTCSGWCRKELSGEEYRTVIGNALMILQGKYAELQNILKTEMESAAERLDFESAAVLRDRRKAISLLQEKQLVNAGRISDCDFIGYCRLQPRACFLVLHYAGGKLMDKDFEILDYFDEDEIPNLLLQYYSGGRLCPKEVILPDVTDSDEEIEAYLSDYAGRKVALRHPQKGDYAKLSALAMKNALEEVERLRSKSDRLAEAQAVLGNRLVIPELHRIEAYDISNISGTDIVASMVVVTDGCLSKKDYKRFKISDFPDQDDIHCMEEVLKRRFTRYREQSEGFTVLPELLLIDGGRIHAETAARVAAEFNLNCTVLGMVKDDRHRTNALISPYGEILEIKSNLQLFSFIGMIQEEVHRFAITYHRSLRSKRLTDSELDRIPGIGPKRKQMLLNRFHSLKNVREASLEVLQQCLPEPTADAVYRAFHKEDPAENESD